MDTRVLRATPREEGAEPHHQSLSLVDESEDILGHTDGMFWQACCLGCATLLAWNIVLITFDYFANEVFSDPDFVNKATAEYFLALFATQTVFMFYVGPRIAFFPAWCVGILLNSLGLMGLWLCPSSERPLSVLCVVALGTGTALLQTSLNGLVGPISIDAINASMVGQGVAGVISAAASLVKPTFVTVGVTMSSASFVILASLPVYLFKFRWNPQVRSVERQKTEFIRQNSEGSPIHASAESARRRRDVFSDAFPQARNAWLVFFTTFSVFPGVALRWTSANGMPDSRFRPIVAGVFQVGDIIGRYTPSATWAQVRPDFVKFFAFARIVFVPLFIYLAQHETSDILTISVMLIFSVSNGYCATLSMMYGPGQVSRKNEKEMVGYLMVTFLVGGILSGSLAAFPVANQFFPPNY
jgi:hypothetical protein